jgi:hypothetical protein
MSRPRGGLGEEQFYFRPAIPGGVLKEKIVFEAHIIGLTDSSSPGWDENFDMGRADPVMTYRSMARNINISFVVVAVDTDEQSQNYLKLRNLANLTYPIYESNKGYNAPHVYYGIGYHLRGYGILTSLDFNWSGDQPWVDQPQRPLITEVSLNIRVLGDDTGLRPEYQKGEYNYFGD